jgi:hypothetical protein
MHKRVRCYTVVKARQGCLVIMYEYLKAQSDTQCVSEYLLPS